MRHACLYIDYKWIDYDNVSDEDLRSDIHSTINAIQSATGSPPVGWYTGRIGTRTRRIVFEEFDKLGLPLLYECDAYNDDLPYWANAGGKGRLVIPYTLDQNDMKFCVVSQLIEHVPQ